MRRYHFLIAACLLCWSPFSPAQEPTYREDLRFVESLRARGDNDLALEFLQRLSKNAPAELAKELPLELAKTRLRVASEEPETGKRLAMYKEARDDFQKFINGNPGHPRIPEANLDIARVLNLQGKTELNRALLAEDRKSSQEMATTARTTLQQAAKRLEAAAKELETRFEALPDPNTIEDAKKKKEAQLAKYLAERDLKETQLDIALNLFDQSSTYIGGVGNELAAKLLEKAKDLLSPLSNGDVRQPVTWKALAWIGRIAPETETIDKAHAYFQRVLAQTGNPAASEGFRLATYFRLLTIKKKPRDIDIKRPGGINAYVIVVGRNWRNDYRRFLHTSEGYGLTFLLAKTLLEEANVNKRLPPTTANSFRAEARNLLRELETSENEFTEEARQLKLQSMLELGVFKRSIKNLNSFEDCYVRAQYEAFQMNKEQNEGKPDEAKRKERITAILQVLERALGMPEVKKKKKGDLELNNARSMYSFWSLNTGKLEETIRVGEAFARQEPGSSQAEMAAVYALQAYMNLIGQKAQKFEDFADDRARLLSLAGFMENTWSKSLAGDVARHYVALQLLRDKEPNYSEAIKKLSLIEENYGNYTAVCRLTADACMKAQREGVEPIVGDRAGDYRKRALIALERMPENALGADPFTNQVYMAGKAELGRELFKYKRFQQMDDLAGNLLGKIDKLTFSEDPEKNIAIRNQLRFELTDVKLYARYGLADVAFLAGDNAKVVSLLDPLIDAASKTGESQEKANLQRNPQLGNALMVLALRSNINLGKIDQTEKTLGVMDLLLGANGDPTQILRTLAGLIRGQVEDLRKKSDKDALKKAIDGYTVILDKRISKQTKTSTEFLRVVADCYSSMEKHAKAAEILGKIVEPKPGTEDEKAYRLVKVALIRELRRSKTPENLKKARELLEGIMTGPDKKPGWGARDLLALKELGQLWEAENKLNEAFGLWSNLVKRLNEPARKGGPAKEHYLECYYHMVLSYYKYGMTLPSKVDRDKYVSGAAQQIITLEKAWEEFGSDTSKTRFTELLAQEAALREQYETLKKKK